MRMGIRRSSGEHTRNSGQYCNLSKTQALPTPLIELEPAMINKHLAMSYIGLIALNKTGQFHGSQRQVEVDESERTIRKRYQQEEYINLKKSEDSIEQTSVFHLLVECIDQKKEEEETSWFCGASCLHDSKPPTGCQSIVEMDREARELFIYNFSDKKTKNVRYYINLETVMAQVLPTETLYPIKQTEEMYSFQLQLAGDSRYYLFSTPNHCHSKQLSAFREQLELAIEESLGKKYRIVPPNPDYKYKSLQQFETQCQTGDIILFRSFHMMAGLQRLFTSSEYDHVGMLIKDPLHGILIFESTSQAGVCLVSWDRIMQKKFYKHVERISWRKLKDIERNRQFIDSVVQFVTENLHRQFAFGMQKMMLNISTKQQADGFFCSELVAKTYKNLGLLAETGHPSYKPSNSFYPFHFTEKNELTLIKGKLSPEYQIQFLEQQADTSSSMS